MRGFRMFLAAIATMAASATFADEFKQTNEAATIGYEGPSTRATKQFIYSRNTPLEVLVQIEGWYKVRDSQGALVWIERKALAERAHVQVKPTTPTDVLTAPDSNAAVAFRVEAGVLLTLLAPPSPATGPFAQIRHRDGQTGFVRVDAVFGL